MTFQGISLKKTVILVLNPYNGLYRYIVLLGTDGHLQEDNFKPLILIVLLGNQELVDKLANNYFNAFELANIENFNLLKLKDLLEKQGLVKI